MFVVKSNEEIGSHLESLIIDKYPSVRQFCIAYLDIDPSRDPKDPTEIRNITNRFSQIIHGKKAIQTYDLPFVSELLGVSCEDILSCGETKLPLKFRRTNYNIAFSKDEADWIEYLSREDCIAAYADEFGKTVLDYSIEFKNYAFIKFLIDRDYITLISPEPHWHDFGAESKIVERPSDHPRLQDEFYTNKLLRTQILSLAIANNDIDALEKFRARELPPQLQVNTMWGDLDFSEYYDETFIKEVVNSQTRVFNYFLEEYSTKTYGDKEITWIYPFINSLISECLKAKKHDRALKAIDVVLKHNKNVFELMRKKFLLAAKKTKDLYQTRPFPEAVDMVSHDYHITKEENFASFHPYHIDGVDSYAFNIIKIECSSKDEVIQAKINESNELHSKIVNLPNNLIKNNLHFRKGY